MKNKIKISPLPPTSDPTDNNTLSLSQRASNRRAQQMWTHDHPVPQELKSDDLDAGEMDNNPEKQLSKNVLADYRNL